jgi:uncharacterized RDD family membrane protein YckC
VAIESRRQGVRTQLDGRARPAAAGTALAGWWSRAGAYVADTAVLLPLVAALSLIAWAAGATEWLAIAVGWSLTQYMIRGLFYAPGLMRRPGPRNGQTLGKQWAGVRVTRDDGRPVDFPKAVEREWLIRTLLFEVFAVAFTGTIATILDYTWPLMEENNKALHDRLAATTVARAD